MPRQNMQMPKISRSAANRTLSLRMKEPEAERFWRLMDAAKERNPYADKSDIIRELLGLSKPDILTTEEIHYFRTGEKSTNK